ncbi:hypothetical protein BKA16_004688 [Gordonia humi]|uniref:Transposase DDE domain-containing protein n=1 Tax=Gordonia humi TaxID=686429 RepID=A0A840F682_9ACTN|nr:hypothetical protein [Gordonia humi]
MSHAGLMLVTRTAELVGLPELLREALAPWRKDHATHDPGKIISDLAISLVAGGDCPADLAVVRGSDTVFGSVASDPTASRLFALLAADAPKVLAAIDKVRAATRERVWALAGPAAPNHQISATNPLVLDLDATITISHSDEKENAAPTFKKTFGFHTLASFIDHGPGGTGEAAVAMLRPGNAGSNTAADHITVIRDALGQIPGLPWRAGKKILIRADTAGGTREVLNYLHKRGLSYSVGFTMTNALTAAVDKVRKATWTQAYNSDGQPREGAQVAELTGLLSLSGYPKDMRVIVRRERIHPGAQGRITDRDGWRLTAFATNSKVGQLAELEMRHRRRARCEDRIRQAKDAGLRNFPFKEYDKNKIWLALIQLAADLTAWTQMLALTSSDARTCELKRLRLRLWAIAARSARHARTQHLRYDRASRWTPVLLAGLHRLDTYRSSA